MAKQKSYILINMNYYEVAPGQIFRQDTDTFTYSSVEVLKTGQIVQISVGKKMSLGVVIKKVTKPDYPTKPIENKIGDYILPEQSVKLAQWISSYYITPLALVLKMIMPTGIQKKRRNDTYSHPITKRQRTNILLNNDQQAVLKQLSSWDSGTFLLHGVTGSGKTEIYIQAAKQAVESGKSVVVLVPEISLTPQLISEFSNHFDNLLVTHSKMTESSRHVIWNSAINSTSPSVAIGPRSALFLPLRNIGLIVVDESHEPSYKQESSPKYSALRAATILGRLHDAKVIFGSATPSIIDLHLANQSNKPILTLKKSAREIKPPIISVVDMTEKTNFRKHRFLSNQLLEGIEKTLKDKKQVLLFHNRRGSAATTLCQDCGWTADCPKCHLPLSLHSDSHELVCHICGLKVPIPTSCPICNNTNIIHKGIGTKLIESELRKMYPNNVISRFDTDNNSSTTADELYKKLYEGEIDIIIGTQSIAKGLDLPSLRMVGIIQADTGLSLPDYGTEERVFQLIAQVVGRVGRNNHETQVVVQTYKPEHPSIAFGVNQDYVSFYEYSIKSRQKTNFPPYSFLMKFTCSYKTERSAVSNSIKLAGLLRENSQKDVTILGPTPAFYERQNGNYRWQLILKSPKREHLTQLVKLLPANNWQFEIDPTSLL